MPQGGNEKKFSVETGDELHRLNAMLRWIRETKVMTADLHRYLTNVLVKYFSLSSKCSLLF